MSKSIKLKGNNYFDSSGVIHNREQLSNILNNSINRLNELIDYDYVSSDETFPQNKTKNNFTPLMMSYSSSTPINIDNFEQPYDNTRVMGFSIQTDGGLVSFQIACITYSDQQNLIGKLIYRYKHGGFGISNWKSIN